MQLVVLSIRPLLNLYFHEFMDGPDLSQDFYQPFQCGVCAEDMPHYLWSAPQHHENSVFQINWLRNLVK